MTPAANLALAPVKSPKITSVKTAATASIKPAIKISARTSRFTLQSGFSLPELLAAMAITLVLMTLALPGYQAHQHRVERVQALQGLQGAARCHTTQLSLQGKSDLTRCLPAPSRTYRYLVVPARGGLELGHEWRAEPLGAQRRDGCGTLVLDHEGRKYQLGTPARGVACWRGR